MATDTAGEDFVTIVPVGQGRPSAKDSSFVTVLTVGAVNDAAEVVVRRPRGERLGLGLKFEGGSAAAEKVRRLLVQSCAEDSPAANARTPWGKLIPGDEILSIDGVSVLELTRIDCVRRLKDSDESLTLLVRHFEPESNTEPSKDMPDSAVTPDSAVPKQTNEIVRPTMLPPPVPPRKIGKKNSFKDKSTLQTVGEQIDGNDGGQQNDKESIINGKHNGISTLTKLSRKCSFDSHLLRQNKESIAYLKKGSPEEVRRLVRRLSDGKVMPPEAEVYIDLLSSEWERCLVFGDAESESGSSISTVVDRLGSMTNSVENSIPSTPIMQQKTIDIQKVLNSIENIDTNILRDMTTKKSLRREVLNELKVTDKTTTVVANGTSTTLNSLTTEEILQSKEVLKNDKNNNNTVLSNIISSNEKSLKNNENKIDGTADKPKPMPRSTKVERSASDRKPRPIPIPETPPPPVPESLLTPTKKNCIETWLQRSEAEMNNNKTIEKLEDNTLPEALPRLIDFVPKPQFKESVREVPLSRPTAPPPPPPAETREDGSGASLDTIGELDETSDVTDNAKPISTNQTKERKSSFERSFWEDRINKSDTEDKSLSNDETPLPSCPRQPPDGVETPSEAVEKIPDPPTRLPPLHYIRPRYSYTSRTQDARSEASVKAKIAMFSNDHAISTDRLDKCGTLPNRSALNTRNSTATYNYSEASSLDRRLTKSQDNLDELPRYCKKPTEIRPEVSGGLGSTTISNFGMAKTNRSLLSENKPLFYGSTTTLPPSTDSSFSQPLIYHARSTSDDSGSKNISKHKSNLEQLIEQRKKSMSKLRGLVIPEIHGPVVGLPEIKVQDNVTKTFLLKATENNNIKSNNKQTNVKPIIINETKWKTHFSNNIPKYSPAFKRKSLQVYSPSSMSKESTPERSFSERIETLNKLNQKSNKTLRASLDLNDTPKQLSTSILPSKGYLTNTTTYATKKDFMNNLNYTRDYKNLDIKICTVTDIMDSDNDSAMSSTQSSYRSSASSPMHTLENIESDSSRLSPRISNYTYSLVKSELPVKSATEKSYEEYIKRSVCRSMSSDTNVSLSSSAGSAATSGSQASCSSLESSVADSDKRKVSKTYNVDTLNRRNILASAKCRSGRDANLTSPVIETKFSHESRDRSPSPVPKASERLSTLTPSVSAVSNKGENRRRNKVIAESDSDSDSDVNIRQRKADFKNSRLKRNSSSANKNKQTENSSESPKAEDAPRVISEKIIKEMKKGGLENYTSTKSTALLDTRTFDIIKTEATTVKTEEKTFKSIVPAKPKESNICDIQFKEKPVTKVTNKTSLHDMTDINGSSAPETQILTRIIRLKRGAGSGVGVILAGGIDCEAKDVTVHRVLADSVAAKAGLKRGVKVRSINGCAMMGLTHAQSVTILKEQRSEVSIEIEIEPSENASGRGCDSERAGSEVHREVEGGVSESSDCGSVVTVMLEKAGGGAGLGFGLDGGRDSPRGDCPLTIKKLFAGGAAAQSGLVLVGAELLSAGGQSMEGFTRTKAWAALKGLPPGPVALVLRNPKP